MPRRRTSRNKAPSPHWRVVERALARQRRSRALAGRHGQDAEPDAEPRLAPAFPTVYVIDALARETAKLLTLATPEPGAPEQAVPEVVYWIGFKLGELACVTTLIVPATDVPEDAVVASTIARDETFVALATAPLVLLAAVCPQTPKNRRPSPFADRDEDGDFAGVLVVETPPFDQGRFDFESCTVHRQIDGERRQLSAAELPQHLRLVPGYRDLRRKSRTSSKG